jgi:folate-binding protein YgfZ
MDELEMTEELAAGRAFVDLSSWRKIGVSGGDAVAWLNDLISADIADLAPGEARRSLLLSPTGKVRAAFTVTAAGGAVVLIQDPVQPRSIADLLSPYVLSSDAALEDRTHELSLFAFPGRPNPPESPATIRSAPSCVGPGADLLSSAADHDPVLAHLSETFEEASQEALEAWRVGAGLARFGVDGAEDDLPQEAGLGAAVSFDKGCFLGQETVAKVRNLGHPRRLVMRLGAERAVSPGDAVMGANGTPVGEVTSAAGHVALARIRWEAREGPFAGPGGVTLTPAAS